MKYKTIVLLLICLTTGTARAEEFVAYESGICRFNLYDYEMTKPVERAIVFGISRLADTYKDTFGFRLPDNFKVRVTIICGEEKFKEYQEKQIGKVISETGYFSGRDWETVVLQPKDSKKTKDAKEMIGVVFHEANHMMMAWCVPWCPDWLNEGLSEYFEGLNVMGENRRVYLQEARSKWCKLWSRKGFPIELREYLSLSHDQWMGLRGRDINAAYTIGYSLIYFMMSRESTEKVLKELLWEFKRYGLEADSVKIINENYPGGLEKLERNWKKWIPKARPYRPLRALRKQKEKLKEQTAAADQNSKKKE